jgi:hypothetical protein
MTLTASSHVEALVDPGEPVELAIRQIGHEVAEGLEPLGVGGDLHDTEGYRTIPEGVKPLLPETEPSTDTPPVVLRTSPVADRIRAHVEERRRDEPKYSMRALSKAAGLNPSQLTMILRRLDEGADIGHTKIEDIARAMGRSHHWLLRGEEAPTKGVRVGSLEDFEEVAALLRADYPKLTDRSMTELADVTIPRSPKKLTVARLLALAVGIDVFLGES